MSSFIRLTAILHRFDNVLQGKAEVEDLKTRNQKLADYKRVGGYLVWEDAFPRTASMKVKRQRLVEELRKKADRAKAVRSL